MSAGCSVEFVFFFFSSRRRHTRYWRDWSSDVCSSDLKPYSVTSVVSGVPGHQRPGDLLSHLPHFAGVDAADVRLLLPHVTQRAFDAGVAAGELPYEPHPARRGPAPARPTGRCPPPSRRALAP